MPGSHAIVVRVGVTVRFQSTCADKRTATDFGDSGSDCGHVTVSPCLHNTSHPDQQIEIRENIDAGIVRNDAALTDQDAGVVDNRSRPRDAIQTAGTQVMVVRYVRNIPNFTDFIDAKAQVVADLTAQEQQVITIG
jgi:hypothetical protein